MILVPKMIPVPNRRDFFKIADVNATVKPRSAGPLIPAIWQLFTAERIQWNEPVSVLISNEITLAQLVSAYIIPSGFEHLDSNTVFSWALEVVENNAKHDKTKRTVVDIPYKIPHGFNLRVLVDTLHADDDRRQVVCAYGVAKIRF
jgi:hypothetical protein